jgi:hypothetical protein
VKVYLAGPMRGIADFNFPAFFKAAEVLRAQGYKVFSPAEKDIEDHGDAVYKNNPTGDVALAASRTSFDIRAAIWADLEYIVWEADAIALLPGWEKSKGVMAELATAKFLDLEVIELDERAQQIRR